MEGGNAHLVGCSGAGCELLGIQDVDGGSVPVGAVEEAEQAAQAAVQQHGESRGTPSATCREGREALGTMWISTAERVWLRRDESESDPHRDCNQSLASKQTPRCTKHLCARAHATQPTGAATQTHTHMHTQPTHAHPTPGSACMTANTQTYWHINCSKRAPGVLVVPERLHRHKVVQECPPGLRVLHHMRPAHAQLLQGRTPGPLLLLQTRCWWARPERDLVLSKEGFEGLPQKEQRSVDPKKAMLSSLWFKRHPHKGAHASHSVQVNGGPRAEPVCQHIVYSTICNTI